MCERVKKMMDSKYFTLNTSLQIIIIVFYLPVNMIFFLYLVNNNTSDIFTGFQKCSMLQSFAALPVGQLFQCQRTLLLGNSLEKLGVFISLCLDRYVEKSARHRKGVRDEQWGFPETKE